MRLSSPIGFGLLVGGDWVGPMGRRARRMGYEEAIRRSQPQFSSVSTKTTSYFFVGHSNKS